MTRLPPLDPESFTEAQRKLIDGRPARAERGPYLAWLQRPLLAERMAAALAYVRSETLLETRIYELVILAAARIFGADYAWAAHVDGGRKAGLSAEVIIALRDRKPVPFQREDEAAAHAATVELLAEQRLSDATHARAVAAFGPDGCVDLVALIGIYAMVGITLRAFEIGLPEDLVAMAP